MADLDIINLLKSPVLFDHKTHPAFQKETIEDTINEIVALRAKLAEAEATIAALRKDQGDWRKGVELIASGLGESDPPNLSCVRIAHVALELRAKAEALEAKLAEAEAKYDADVTSERAGYAELVHRTVTTAEEAGYDVPVNGATAFEAACWMRDQLVALRREGETWRRALRYAVNALCSCGGCGPDDVAACDACRIWHSVYPVRVVPTEGGQDE